MKWIWIGAGAAVAIFVYSRFGSPFPSSSTSSQTGVTTGQSGSYVSLAGYAVAALLILFGTGTLKRFKL